MNKEQKKTWWLDRHKSIKRLMIALLIAWGVIVVGSIVVGLIMLLFSPLHNIP